MAKKSNTIAIAGTIINTEGQLISYVVEGFKITLINTDINQTDVVLSPDSTGYIWGTVNTFDGCKAIAIFVKKNITVRTVLTFNTWNYIVLNIRVSVRDNGALEFPGFDGIRFANGSVMSVNPCWSLHEDKEKADELNKTEKNNDKSSADTKEMYHYIVHRVYPNVKSFSTVYKGETVEWVFGSNIKSSRSLDRGSYLKNDVAILDIRFETKQELQTFYDFYGYVNSLLAFLIFRNGAVFEKVSLLYKDSLYGYREFADCYINTVIDYYSPNKNIDEESIERLSRNPLNSLTVYRLSDKTFNEMFKIIAKTEKKTVDLPINVFPKDSRDLAIFSIDKIKNICSALEVEMDAAEIKVCKSDVLKSLIENVKNIIKNHRESSEEKLPDNTYNNMFNSISHWGDSLADRAVLAWHKHEGYLSSWSKMRFITINDDEIAEVVKARNKITHSGFKDLDDKICETAYYIMGLIYVMALKRVYIDDAVIKDIIAKEIIG